jgi:tetratricopeptide (TPR) repeat protein
VALLFVVPCLAQTQDTLSLSGRVEAWKGDRLTGVTVRVTNAGDALSSRTGEFTIPLPAEHEPGTPIYIELIDGGQPWIVVRPWGGWGYVPEPGDSLRLLVLPKGDKRFVTDTEIVRSILEAATTWLVAGSDVGAEPRFALAEMSLYLGYELEELKSVVAEWGEKEDPYLKGLFELYSGRYAEASTLIRESVSVAEVDRVEKYLALASAEYARGHYQAAESALLDGRALCPENPLILNAQGVVAFAEARHADAESLFRSALAIRQATLGDDHRDVGASLTNLAAVFSVQGRYAEAEPFIRRALEIYEARQDPEYLHVAGSLHNLAEMLRMQEKYSEAEPHARRALAIWEAAAGSWNQAVAMSLNTLALLLDAQGKYADAELMYRRSLDIYEYAFGPNHPSVAVVLTNLALLLGAEGEYAEAERLLRRALYINEAALGPEHLNVAAPLFSLGKVLGVWGKHAQAEEAYRRAVAIVEANLGPEHPNIAKPLNVLAVELYRQGKYAEAEMLYRRSLAIVEVAWGPEHPDVATIGENLARVLRRLGRVAEAEELEERVARIRGGGTGRN